jgi:hypothetical protein
MDDEELSTVIVAFGVFAIILMIVCELIKAYVLFNVFN